MAASSPSSEARARAAPDRGRRRGVVPNDLDARLSQIAGGELGAGIMARSIAAHLKGLAPGLLTDVELAELVEDFGGDQAYVDRGLELLTSAGYGAKRPPLPRKQRAYGSKRKKRREGLIGKLPRALAQRMPTTADTRRTGPMDGTDRYGPVTCSSTMRARHLGAIAWTIGMWHSRSPEGVPYAQTTAEELADLMTKRRRGGGKDLADVHRTLEEILHLDLHAAPPAKVLDGSNPRDFEIPGPPFERITRWLPDGRWVDAAEYKDALASMSDEDRIATMQADGSSPTAGHGTIRIYLAAWVRHAIAQGHVTYLNPTVWTYLRPLSQRVYAFLQATGRDGYDDTLYFYLAEPQRYTFGLRGLAHRNTRSVRDALNAIRLGDRRYTHPRVWDVERRHPNTRYAAFRISARGPSCPTDLALEKAKCLAQHPVELRGLSAKDARERARMYRKALERGLPPAPKSTPRPTRPPKTLPATAAAP